MAGVLVLALLVGVPALLIVLIVRRARQKRRPGVSLRELGSLLDQSLTLYRRHLAPLLLLSLLCLPFGTSSRASLGLLTGVLLLAPARLGGNGSDLVVTALLIFGVLSVIGLGRVLLLAGITLALQHADPAAPRTLLQFWPQQRRGALLGVAALLVVPSLASSLLGIIGTLVALLWALAPVVCIAEGLGPWASLKRSVQLARRFYSALLNTTVLLWLIGWLVVGTLAWGAAWLLGLLVGSSAGATAGVLLAGWLLGEVVIAPLVAVGTFCCYGFVRAREQPEGAGFPAQPPPFL